MTSGAGAATVGGITSFFGPAPSSQNPNPYPNLFSPEEREKTRAQQQEKQRVRKARKAEKALAKAARREARAGRTIRRKSWYRRAANKLRRSPWPKV
jgi:hypothetical protein